ncbi:DUF4258 domain-containing protein [Candidatus Sumerlaeota bacterium]|nr:DUF4258 domain-containing protein [Candidatus Sumerlaeota bacterium]
MTALIPSDPLRFIKDHVRDGRVLWTYHVNMRLAERHISRQEVLGAVDSYEIIEQYPKGRHLPCYLVLARFEGDAFHVVFAVDVEGGNVRVVTAYWPDPGEWDIDLKTRRFAR